MEGTPTESRPRGLAPWVLLPLAGLLAILVAVSNLPGSDCDGYEDPRSAAEVVLIAITAVASLGCVAAAVRRVLALGRAGADLSALIAIGALAIAAIVAGGTLVEPGTDGLIWGSLLVGTAATGISLLVLLVAWLARKTPDEAGPLVLIYLLGAGVFVFPGFTMLALVVNSGALC